MGHAMWIKKTGCERDLKGFLEILGEKDSFI